jgi:hypothetical protein
MAILDKFNTKDVLGKYAGAENRNPTEINQYSTGKYNISQFSYPEDVTTKADLQHYVAFYINVREKSKFKPENTINIDVSSRGQNRLDPTTAQDVGTAIATVGVVAEVANKTLGGVDFKKLAQTIGKSGSVRSKVGFVAKVAAAPAAGIATAGALTALQAFSNTLKVDTPKRIQDAVVLHIDKPPQVKYSMKYTEIEMGILGGLLGGSSAIESTAAGRLSEAGQSALLSAASLPKAAIAGQILGGIPSPKAAILSGAKVQTNPFKEVIFESIDPRTFSFTYTFLPRSAIEVQNIKNIIDLFKFHMHPELSANGLFYVYPSEFEIVYYYQGKENRFVNKISTCVLTDMDVKYGGDYFSTFKDGAPAEVSMSLNFRELELLTKERIVKGY